MRNRDPESNAGAHRFLALFERGENAVARISLNFVLRHEEIDQLDDRVPALRRLHLGNDLLGGKYAGERHAQVACGERSVSSSLSKTSGHLAAASSRFICHVERRRDIFVLTERTFLGSPGMTESLRLSLSTGTSVAATAASAHRTYRRWRGWRDYRDRTCSHRT